MNNKNKDTNTKDDPKAKEMLPISIKPFIFLHEGGHKLGKAQPEEVVFLYSQKLLMLEMQLMILLLDQKKKLHEFTPQISLI